MNSSDWKFMKQYFGYRDTDRMRVEQEQTALRADWEARFRDPPLAWGIMVLTQAAEIAQRRGVSQEAVIEEFLSDLPAPIRARFSAHLRRARGGH